MVQQLLTSQVSANSPSLSNSPILLALPSGPSATSGVDSSNQNNTSVNAQNNQSTVQEATTQDAGTMQK